MTAESSSQAGSEPADVESPAVTPDENGQYDLKGKFREALARKREKQAEAADLAGHTDASKIRGAHGPAASQRSFRRKSGG
ncbi:DUF5302 domain-containing protein [Streptomyces pactum]|uniref:DUF5302 domain-containing protein n=1 Tax=Streptomyces pactum TaxID=68249 RepID=A0A1S6J269_9ACTN|nr:DUF5302 domain-containing protein [Streptomyces pactum]AQS65840.1 hypothetical protein B1H29_01800 [Streptomyces pactum]